MQPACKERLYLPHDELGRGLHSVAARGEMMLLQLWETMAADVSISTRRAAIVKSETAANSQLSLIKNYLQLKYSLQSVDKDALEAAQKASLYSKITEKSNHQKLYRVKQNEQADVKASATWLRHGNISPQSEAHLCLLQDRNTLGGQAGQCPHCNRAAKTVDHLATRCEAMLGTHYTRRHNEAVRSIHMLICRKYGLTSARRIRGHSVQEVTENENAEVRVDTWIKTTSRIRANRPDIFVFDKKRREILIIEVGITSQDLLTQVESEKNRKYDVLANEQAALYKCKARIIPYVMTWDAECGNELPQKTYKRAGNRTQRGGVHPVESAADDARGDLFRVSEGRAGREWRRAGGAGKQPHGSRWNRWGDNHNYCVK